MLLTVSSSGDLRLYELYMEDQGREEISVQLLQLKHERGKMLLPP